MGTLASGLVEFEFAVGDPDTCVELVMPEAAFEEFCRNNQVEFLGAVAASATESATADFKWGMRQATNQRFR
jgi:phenol hydroxylase P0 protein